jgi:hypothetical protein
MKQTKCNDPEHIHTRHISESFPHEGGTSICIERKDKHSKVGGKPVRRRQTHIHMMEISKNKTKYKHVREGTQHSANETKLKTITSQAQNIKHFLVHVARRIHEAFFDKMRGT